MPRLFTGLELPEAIRAELAQMRGGIAGARWVEPENYHITLRFVGDVDLRQARETAESLGDLRRSALTIEFEGMSWFGADKPRAIVAKIKPTPPLVELQGEHERRLRRIGLAPETRKFAPRRWRSPTISAIAPFSRSGASRRRALSCTPLASRPAAAHMSSKPPIRW